MSDQGSIVMDLFEDNITTQILTRLPAKDVCRFKSVSKRWNSLISHSHFLTSYISRSFPSSSWVILDRVVQLAPESTQDPTRLTLSPHPEISTFSIKPRELAADPVTDPARTKFPAMVLHSSNGLILFTVQIERNPHAEHRKDPTHFEWRFEEPALFVANPVTGEWTTLPKPRHPINQITHVAFTTKVDPVTPAGVKFMVVEYRPLIGSDMGSLLSFSSDVGKWVEKSTNYMLGGHFWRAEGSFEFDSRLFWVDLSTGFITWDAKNGDCFTSSLGNDRAVCRFIPLPKGRAKPFNTPGLEDERMVGVGGGCIQFMEVLKKGKTLLKVWKMKDCQSGEWSMVHKVARVEVERYLSPFGEEGEGKCMPRPCFVHPFEAHLAYFETGDCIFSLDLNFQIVVSCGSFKGFKYVLPFVIPSWPTSLPSIFYAARLKEQGNELLKSQKYVEAIKYYSKCINLSPSAAAYANRAMAYLKVNKYTEAEIDCTEALNLDAKYLKVLVRRAMARQQLGNLEGAMEDLEFALKLEPDHCELKDHYAKVKSLLEEVSRAESEYGHEAAAGDLGTAGVKHTG